MENSKENRLERFFKIRERGSSIRTELIGGFTLFFTVSYILVVNPDIMQNAGMPFVAIAAGTALCCSISTLLIAFIANYPIVIAPSMGINAFVAFVMCGSMGLSWQQSMAIIFIAGLIFIVLTVIKVRSMIIEAIPSCIRYGIVVGLGLFLTLIGLSNAGVVVANPDTVVALGNIQSPEVALTLIGVCITGFLFARRFKGAFLLGILITTVIGIPMGVVQMPSSINELFTLVPASPGPVFAKLDFHGLGSLNMITLILSFTLISMFDAMGTLITIAGQAGWVKDDGKVEGIDRALLADSLGTTVGTLFGGTVATAYIESTVGVAEGARTGLSAAVAGVMFLIALFCTPFIALIPIQATTPVLIIVGFLMIQEVVHVDFTNFAEGFSAFVIIIMMPLTYSIATGIAMGFITFAVFKLLTGKIKEIHPIMGILAILFVLNFALGYTVGG